MAGTLESVIRNVFKFMKVRNIGPIVSLFRGPLIIITLTSGSKLLAGNDVSPPKN